MTAYYLSLFINKGYLLTIQRLEFTVSTFLETK
jgi:hypothetical protein